MEGKKINVTVENEVSELIIREGSAPDLLKNQPPVKIDISGVIGSPVEFLSKRISDPEQVNQLRSHVLIDRSELKITLVLNENDSYTRSVVTGKLELHPKFLEFGINTDKCWEPNKLGQFFKMNRSFFEDKNENMTLVTELKNFVAKVNNTIERQKNENGSFADNYSAVVSSNIPKSFRLLIPIFKGRPAEHIGVEFYASISGKEVLLNLVSPGANQILEEIRDSVIDEQFDEIRELAPDIAIIEQ